MKNKIKNLLYLTPLFINNVFADDFFDDYPNTNLFSVIGNIKSTQRTKIINSANKFLAFGYQILKWVWIGLIIFTVTNIIMTIVRLVIHADDWAGKKMQDKHELWNEFIALAILGATPTVFWMILSFLN